MAKPRRPRWASVAPTGATSALAAHLNPPTERETRRPCQGGRSSPPALARGRTYGYTRVSTDMQAEHGQSLELQARPAHRLGPDDAAPRRPPDRRGLACSGSIPFAKRPEGREAVSPIWSAGDAVVCTKIDRFSRNLFDCPVGSRRNSRNAGVTLYLLDVDGADPVTGKRQVEAVPVHAGARFAEFERDRISSRIRESKQRAEGQRRVSGRPSPVSAGIHDENRKLVPVPEQAGRRWRPYPQARSRWSQPLQDQAPILAERGVKLSHVTVRKIIGQEGPPP